MAELSSDHRGDQGVFQGCMAIVPVPYPVPEPDETIKKFNLEEFLGLLEKEDEPESFWRKACSLLLQSPVIDPSLKDLSVLLYYIVKRMEQKFNQSIKEIGDRLEQLIKESLYATKEGSSTPSLMEKMKEDLRYLTIGRSQVQFHYVLYVLISNGILDNVIGFKEDGLAVIYNPYSDESKKVKDPYFWVNTTIIRILCIELSGGKLRFQLQSHEQKNLYGGDASFRKNYEIYFYKKDKDGNRYNINFMRDGSNLHLVERNPELSNRIPKKNRIAQNTVQTVQNTVPITVSTIDGTLIKYGMKRIAETREDVANTLITLQSTSKKRYGDSEHEEGPEKKKQRIGDPMNISRLID